jgi:hypothetical protein
MNQWVGIDQGYSHLAVAVVDAHGTAVCSESTEEPEGDGHDRKTVLVRLGLLLDRLEAFRAIPAGLAGYCYNDSGIREAFTERGWCIEDVVALNDVVGVYGLTEMRGHVVVAGCGSWPQTIYVDSQNNVRWAGRDVEQGLPDWLLCGNAYSRFLRESGLGLGISEDDFRATGYRLERLIDHPEVREFVRRAAEAARKTRDVFWRYCGQQEAPLLVLGGGAVRGDAVWRALDEELGTIGVQRTRVTGDQAVGLVRFALANPTADPWGFIGSERPRWLS